MAEETGGTATIQVEALLKLRDQMTAALNQAGAAATKTAGHVRTAQMDLNRLSATASQAKSSLLGLAAGFGITVGVGKLAKQFVDLNSEQEEATRRLGTMLAATYKFGQAEGPENVEKGMKRAVTLMREFEGVAVRVGVDEEKLAVMGGKMAMMMGKVGKTSADIVPFTEKIAMTARLTGNSFDEAAGSIRTAVMYGMGRSEFLKTIGINARELRKASEPERFKLIEKALAKFGVTPEQMERMETYKDATDKLRVLVEQIMEEGGKPFFDQAKKATQDMLKWMKENRTMVEGIVRDVGTTFVSGLQAAVEAAKFLAKHFEAVKAAVVGIATVFAVKKGFGMIGTPDFMSAKGVQAWGGRMKGEASGIGKSMGLATKGLMIAEAAAIGYAIGTAINDLLMKTEWWKKLWTPSETQGERAISDTHRREMERSRIRSRAIDEYVTGYQQLHTGSTALQAILKLQGAATEAGAGGLLLPGGRAGGEVKIGDVSDYMMKSMGIDPVTLKPLAGRAKGVTPEGAEAETARAPSMDFRGSQFHIEQKFAEGFDPDRIAVALANDLAVVGERKLSSAFAPMGAVR